MIMKKIGILGGTFDPVHAGHIRVAEEAMQALALNEVIFMVSGTPHYKVGMRKVSSKEDRLAMTELAIKDHPAFSVSDLECRREGNTYTADTLQELKKQMPENEYYLLIGADAFFHMIHWYRIEAVMANAIVAVVMRGKELNSEQAASVQKELIDKYGGMVVSFEMKPMEVSSTEVREKIRTGGDVHGLVTEDVEAYIQKRSLYREV